MIITVINVYLVMEQKTLSYVSHAAQYILVVKHVVKIIMEDVWNAMQATLWLVEIVICL